MDNAKLILKRWSTPLARLSEEGHLGRVLRILNPLYDNEDFEILPEKSQVFQAFKMLEPENLRVVILGMDPYPNPGEATGYAFANPEESLRLSKSLQKIHEVIENDFHDGLYLDFDITLKHWAEQGVLSLNSSLTVEAKKPGSHLKVWEKFTEVLISELSKNFEGITFCFWGKQAQKYAYLVDQFKHNIFDCYHPAYAVRQGKPWECDHFKKINEYTKPPIKW